MPYARITGLLLVAASFAACGEDSAPQEPAEYVCLSGQPCDEVESILQELFQGKVVLERLPPPDREPNYGRWPPSYCQVAFGPTGAESCWVVRSASTLAIDRDGDGDLAEETFQAGTQVGDCVTFEAVVLKFGDVSYSVVCKFWSDDRAWIEVKDPASRQWRAWGDHKDALEFARSPANAPVVHFDGPLYMGIETRAAVRKQGPQTYRIAAGVGCPGLGAGAFAHLEYTSVPAEAKPQATVFLPGPTKGDEPVSVSLLLEQRC